jgi:homogentisate 1,2-dioxygenase
MGDAMSNEATTHERATHQAAAPDQQTAGATSYQSGFGNEFATEAVAGALPVGQNAPQQVPFGLYAEQLSGTAFTAPRALNRRTWVYRIRPSVMHKPYHQIANVWLRSSPFNEVPASPNQLRWSPMPVPHSPTDFLSGLRTLAGNGDLAAHSGVAMHVYAANRSMESIYCYNADGELLLVPQMGRLLLHTELGRVAVEPGEIALVPRGIKFRVELLDAEARGYLCENYGATFRLPELGPIGANCLANSPPLRTSSGPCRWSANSRAICGRASTITRPWTWLRGMATMRPTNTIWRASVPSTASASIIPTRRSSPCSARLRTRPVRPTATSPSFRRAGWWLNTPSGRPGSIAIS